MVNVSYKTYDGIFGFDVSVDVILVVKHMMAFFGFDVLVDAFLDVKTYDGIFWF